MNIGIETDIIRGKRTGVGNYTLQMLYALQRLDPQIRFLDPQILGWKEFSVADIVADAARETNLKGMLRLKRTLRDVEAARVAYRLTCNLARYITYKTNGISIFHAFNFIPACQPAAPTLPVVYDLSFIRYPDMHPPNRVHWLKRLPKVIERAPLVHTISEFSKNEIANTFNYPRDRIVVAYPAASSQFFQAGFASRAPQLVKMSVSWKRYLLAVGTLEPRKNLKTLLAAFEALPLSVQEHCPLIIVGGRGWGEQDNLSPKIQRLIEKGVVRFLGFVSDADLSCLYEGANLVLYPSIYEGFGMPVVEAMASGARVIHSSKTSMDEIGGNLLKRVDALDVEAWTTCIREAIDSEDLQADVNRRVTRAKVFCWFKSATVIKSAYDLVTTARIQS